MSERILRRGFPGEAASLQAFTEQCFRGTADGSFTALLPKVYLTAEGGVSDYEILEEAGKPLGLLMDPVTELTAGSNSIRVGHISCVCTDPARRGEGVMAQLMESAIADHVAARCSLSVLSGARSRYGHFGFSPAGTRYDLTFETANLSHFDDAGLVLRPPEEKDEPILRAIWQKSSCRYSREQPIAQYLRTWGGEAAVLDRGGTAVGYASLRLRDGIAAVGEFGLRDLNQLPALLRLVYDRYGLDVRLTVAPWDSAALGLSLSLCDRYQLGTDHLMRVHDWPSLLTVLLPLQQQCRPLVEGAVVLSISDQPNICISVEGGAAAVVPAGREVGVCLSPEEAIEVLLTPFSPLRSRLSAECPLLASWFPLPLSIPENDAY